jgi:hypothetical protein
VLQLILHLTGDYILQGQVVATKKTSSWRWASLHVALYMVPFLLFLRPSPLAFVVMAGTHLVIDRLRLAKYWCAFWGVGELGYVAKFIRQSPLHRLFYAREYHEFETWVCDSRNRVAACEAGEGDAWATIDPRPWNPKDPVAITTAPDYLAVWLLIIVDNTTHLAINYAALAYL